MIRHLYSRMSWVCLLASVAGLMVSADVTAQTSGTQMSSYYGSTSGSYTAPTTTTSTTNTASSGTSGTSSSGTSSGSTTYMSSNPGGSTTYSGGSGSSVSLVGSTAVQSLTPGSVAGTIDGLPCCSNREGLPAVVINGVCTIIGARNDDGTVTPPASCMGCGGQGGGSTGAIPQPNAGGGCSSCGGSTPVSGGTSVSGMTNFEPARAFRPDDRAIWSSFGPGMFSIYDSKVYLYPDSAGGTSAVFYDALRGNIVHLQDGKNGDALDGAFDVVQETLVDSLVLKASDGSVVTSVAAASTGVVQQWGGIEQHFDIINLRPVGTPPEFIGRLRSIKDANQHTLAISYRDALAQSSGGFTAQQLADSPERRLQIYQITDWQGDVATISYGATQQSGRWAVTSIDTPDNEAITYSYSNGLLTSVIVPGGLTFPYIYGQDSLTQATTLQLPGPSGTPRTLHLTNEYMTLIQGGTPTIVNQPAGVVRMMQNPQGESEFMMAPDAMQSGVVRVYGGAGLAAEVVLGQTTRYYTDGWMPATGTTAASLTSLATGNYETSYMAMMNTTSAQLYTGAIPQMADETGRQYSYEYDADSFLTKKTFVADGTYEQYSYNAQKKITRLRDRQGNVTLSEYDAAGNLTAVKTGLKEVNGQDVAQPEYSEQRWEYYPPGHYAAGLLKTEFDPNWDGSSTDTHRTDYEYNARGNVTKRLGPAPAPGGQRPETVWTYDAEDRVLSTVDAQGHTAGNAHDASGRVISKTYDDTTTEQTLYGAVGSGQEQLVLKSKDRRNIVTSYSYDASGRATQVIVGSAIDANILDGQPDDSPITDRNQQSITNYSYLQGTDKPVSVIRDGAVTNLTYDYRQRVIATKVYPYEGKMLESKKVYVDNKLFCEEDPYGRKKYYGYRASDGQLIRYVTGAYPSFSLANQAAVFALTRDTNLNPEYTIKDAIADENGRPQTVIDERGTISSTVYDSAGRVIQQIAAVGTDVEAKTETVYDDAGNAIEIRSPRYFDASDVNGYEKCRTVMTYDGAGRVISRTEAPGTAEAGTESYTYDLDGRQLTRTDARGKVWTTTYASCCGHTVASKNPLGHGSITNQNAGGLTVHTAGVSDVASHNSLLNPDDAKTLQETTTLYDALGRSIASTVWLQPLGLVDVANPPIAGFGGVAGTQGLTTQTLYDVDLTDNVGLETTAGLTMTNPLGGTYTVSLSAAIAKLGEPIAQGGAGITFAAGTPGSAVVNINAENEVSFSISDAQGRSLMSGIVARLSETGTSPTLRTWSYQIPDTIETISNKTYLCSVSVDALGNTSKSRSNGLGHTLQSVDQAGNISNVQYDAGGNAIVSRDPNNVGQDCVYDSLGRRTQCTDTVGSVTKTGYDKAGQQITATDAKNKVTHYVFDARGRRRRETDRLNYPTEWEYDAAGNLLSLKDAENQVTAYGYNDAGQRITEQYPDHVAGAALGSTGYGIITFGYDPLGRRITKQDQQGDVTSYNFDMSGRMLTRGYVGHASGPLAGQTNTDTFTYDRAGRMLSGVKGRYNNTITFSYDDRGQQTQETLTTHGQTYTVGYQKNVLGQTTQLQYPDGSLVDRAYTNRGQLQAVNYTPLAGAVSSVATFTYDAGGRETARNLGNGLTTTRSYFADNQIQSIATPTVETLTYTYDANKNPTSETRSGVMAPYSWTTGPSGYDDEDRRTNWSRTNGDSQSWNLSPVHDWASTTINGALQTRTHGPAHEILTMTGAQVSPSPATLQHDLKGNMTLDDRGCGMTWDFDNMMQSFAANGVTDLKNATYEYDAIGRRVAKNVAETGDTATTVFVQAGHQVACEYTPTNSTTKCDRKYVYGKYIDEVLQFVNREGTSEAQYWLHQNRQYSAYSVTSTIGVVTESYRYNSCGEVRCHGPNDNQKLRISRIGVMVTFTGRMADMESCFQYYRNRMYSTGIGTFLGRDTEQYIDGSNLYAAYFAAAGVDPHGTQLGLPGGLLPLDVQVPCPPGVGISIGTKDCVGIGGLRRLTCHLVYWMGACNKFVKAFCGHSGDCYAAEYKDLVARKNGWCNLERSCSKIKCRGVNDRAACAEIRRRVHNGNECISMRRSVMNKCFKGGDAAHRGELQSVIDVRDACEKEYNRCGCTD